MGKRHTIVHPGPLRCCRFLIQCPDDTACRGVMEAWRGYHVIFCGMHD